MMFNHGRFAPTRTLLVGALGCAVVGSAWFVDQTRGAPQRGETKLPERDPRAAMSGVAQDGDMIETEHAIAPQDLPPAVRAALHSRYPGAEVHSAVREHEVVYEVVVMVDGRLTELEFSPNGELEGEEPVSPN
jgi:hypothetical protein